MFILTICRTSATYQNFNTFQDEDIGDGKIAMLLGDA